MQKKVEMSGATASDLDPYVLFTGAGVENPPPTIATADVRGFRGCTRRHPGVDPARGMLASSGGGVVILVLDGEVEQRHVDSLTACDPDLPWTRSRSSPGLRGHDIRQVRVAWMYGEWTTAAALPVAFVHWTSAKISISKTRQ